MSNSARAEDPDERHRGPRTGVEAMDLSRSPIGSLREQRDRWQRAVGRDRHARHDPIVRSVADTRWTESGRDRPRRHEAAPHSWTARRNGRKSDRDADRARRPAVCVQIADGTELKHWIGWAILIGLFLSPNHVSAQSPISSGRFFRPARPAPNAAADFLEGRTATSLQSSSTADTESMSSAPKVSATCASFGP